MRERWEYKIVQPKSPPISSGSKLRGLSEKFLNELGAEGWECYHVKSDDFPSMFYLKRRKDR